MLSRPRCCALLRAVAIVLLIPVVGAVSARGQETICGLPAAMPVLEVSGHIEGAAAAPGKDWASLGEIVRDSSDLLIPVYSDVIGSGTEQLRCEVSSDELTLRLNNAPTVTDSRRVAVGGIDALSLGERMWTLSFAAVERFVPGGREPATESELEFPPPPLELADGPVESSPGTAGEVSFALSAMFAPGPMSESATCTLLAWLGVAWLVRRRNRRILPAMVRVAGGEW